MRISGDGMAEGRMPQVILAGAVLFFGLSSLAAGPAPGHPWLRTHATSAVLAAAAALLAVAVGGRRLPTVLALAGIVAGVAAVDDLHALGWTPGVAHGTAGVLGALVALCAMLSCLAVLAEIHVRWPRRRAIAVVSIGSVILALAAAGLIHDLFPGYRADNVDRLLAGWRALLLGVLGASVILTGRPDRRSRRKAMARWLFIPLALAVAAAGVLLAQYLRIREVRQLHQQTETTLTRVADQLRSRIEASALGLNRMARAWAWRGRPDRNDWKTDAWLFVDHFPEVLAVSWVDPELRVQWLAPLAGFHELQGLYLGFEGRRRATLEHARDAEGLAMSKPVDLVVGDAGFLIAAPIAPGSGTEGFICGFYRIAPLLDGVAQAVAPGYIVRLVDRSEVLFESNGAAPGQPGPWRVAGNLELYGAQWDLQVEPEASTVEQQLSWLPGVTLVIGLGMSLLVGIVVFQADVARVAARRLGREVRRRSRVEHELRRSQQELEARVAARTADLDQKQHELEEKNSELERLATTDPLTGICNRRRFLELAQREVSADQRYGRALAAIMFDLDHFKEINDEHGHQAGDAVLIETARICADILRDTDCLARYGGEEFVVLLTESGRNEAEAVAERLRGAIEQMQVEHEGQRHRVTASFGVAAFAGSRDGLDGFLRRVDRALYEAKSAGRNRVVFLSA